jgi:hypothetical protein
MPEEVVVLIFVAMFGGFSLSGLSMILKARGRRHSEVGREEVDRLTDAVETLHDQVYQLRDSMAELHERVDFAERLLTKGEGKN